LARDHLRPKVADIAEATLDGIPQAVEAITDHPMVVVATPPEVEKVGIANSFHPVGPPRVLTGHVLQRALIFCLTRLRADNFISSDKTELARPMQLKRDFPA
jgi:hypothetical protein